MASFAVTSAKPVTNVEAMRIEFLPGQTMPQHMHPVPVVCFVAKGSFIVSIGTHPVPTAGTGEAK